MLFHVSEDGGIQHFAPRVSDRGEAVVWAVDEAHLRNYLLPRDCPRVTFYAGPATNPSDIDSFLGSSPAVVAVEAGWFDRLRTSRLYCYHPPPATFERVDESAGYFVSRVAVGPARVDVVDDAIAALLERGVEVRVLPDLWALHDAVIASTLQFSMIRMRNARPRQAVRA